MAYTAAELQGQVELLISAVELLISAVKAGAEREAILRAALAEYADADNWAYRTERGIGPNVARAALEQAVWQAVSV